MTFIASGTVISFWYVFSDYKGGDDIFTCIRHNFLLFVCLFWLQRGWDFVASAAIFCFFVCLFWLQKSGWADSILCCIRQHHASGTVISFWYVFSDCKGGDDIFTCIRHNFLLFVCLFWLQRGWDFVASAAIFCFFVCLFWLQKSGWADSITKKFLLGI